MPTVLITGVSGFLGAHLAHVFLENDYTVRGTVRSKEKMSEVVKTSELAPHVLSGKLKVLLVPNLHDPEDAALGAAMKDVDALVHQASPLPNPTKSFQSIVDEAVGVTKSVMEVSARNGVKAVVHLGTAGTVIDMKKPPTEQSNILISDDHVMDFTYEDLEQFSKNGEKANAWGFPTPGLYYFGSKRQAELAAYEVKDSLKGSYSLAVLNPDVIFGPPIHPMDNLKSAGTSINGLTQFLKGLDAPVPGFTPLPSAIDVRDIAKACFLAIEKKANGRFNISGHRYDFQLILDILRKNFPDQAHRAPVGNPGKYAFDTPGVYILNTEKSVRELGMKYRPFEETIVDEYKRLLELEKQGLEIA